MAVFPSGLLRFTKRKRIKSSLPVFALLRQSSEGERRLFSDSVEGPSPVDKFATWLETCEGLISLRKLHARCFTSGLGDNIYLGSKLLNFYALFGSLGDARRVFDKIVNRNLSLWNSALVGYFRAGHFDEVLRLFLDLKFLGIGVDSSALTFGLKSCAAIGNVELGRGIHGDALKIFLNRDKYVGSSLIGLYSRCGCIEDAQRAFEETLDKDVVAYTAMVTTYAQLGDRHAWKAFDIVSCMHRDGVDLNRVTLVSLLQAVGQMDAYKEGRSVHCYAIRRGNGFTDEVFETSLMDMYSRCGSRNAAMCIFNRMKALSVASWNAMIVSLVRCGQLFEALELFNLMKQEENIFPDQITFANILLVCNDLKFVRHATSIHGFIIRIGLPIDLVLATALIDTYSQCHKIKKARELFDKLEKRDVISYNVIISGYLQNGLINVATELIGAMVKEGIQPNSATTLSLLSAVSELADIWKGKIIHGYVVRQGLHSNLEVSNHLLYMYARCQHINISREIFNQMDVKDVVSWTSMMMGYVNYGHADEALALFQLMQRVGEKPDSVTLIGLLQALSQLGFLKQVREIHGFLDRIWLNEDVTILNTLIMTYSKCGRLDIAKVIFNNMQGRELASWNTMIAAYGMHGCFREAIELFHQTLRETVQPDEMTFTSILSVCSHAGQVEEGWRIFYSMKADHLIAPSEEHYACMVDLLARAGHLEEALNFMEHFPLKNSTSALCALLSACRVHGNTKLGEEIGRKLLDLEPQNSGSYALVSNIFFDAGKWSKAATLRDSARDAGFRKTPGYSLIELAKF